MNPELTAYATRVLAGTGLTPGDAARLAADPQAPVPGPAAAAAVAAMRDGWAAASGERR